MKFHWYAGLFVLGVIVMLGIATFEVVPGYMDADYYYASGLRIAIYGTWSEPFIWNYLADPQGLPQPAYTYWMPLAGIFSAIGITLAGKVNFWSARLIFIIFAACIPPLTAYMAYTFTPKRWAALLAGGLALFSGFYFVYLPTTETFGIYMVFGGAVFLLILKMQKDAKKESYVEKPIKAGAFSFRKPRSTFWVYIAAGGISGFMYMTRADGLIWLLMVIIAIIMQGRFARSNLPASEKGILVTRFLVPLILCLAAFLIVSSPWVFRNWSNFGTIFAPGSGRALWLTGYDELYTFPADQLTMSRWLEIGLGQILRARTRALGLNAVSTLAVQGGILLLPLMVVGLWNQRKDWRVIAGGLGWLATFLAMTFIFPYQGARGGFFHAGAGFQTLLWAVVPVGLLEFVNWGKRTRNWEPDSAVIKFALIIVGITILVTGFVSWQRLAGKSGSAAAWGTAEQAYLEVEAYLKSLDVPAEEIVMVNNPPGYYAMTGRQAIVIPDGDLSSTMLAAEKYLASYLVLDQNYPQGLKEIYRYPENHTGLRYLDTVVNMQIYLIEP